MIFHSASYYAAFLQTLNEVHERFGIQIHAYCLMGNHYHLLVKTPKGNLSRCMRHINGLYTQRYNRLKGTDGPLFRGRFKAIIVDKDNYLLPLSGYIHRNPIEVRKPLVKELSNYQWSSYPAYLGKRSAPGWLYREEVYGLLNSQRPVSRYKHFVEQGVDEVITAFYSKQHLLPVLGEEEFKKKIERRSWHNIKREALHKQLYGTPGIAAIIRRVGNEFGVEPRQVKASKRGERNLARQIAIYLCHRLTDKTLSEIAAEFGIGHISGVTQQARRLKRELENDDELAKLVNMLCQHLTP